MLYLARRLTQLSCLFRGSPAGAYFVVRIRLALGGSPSQLSCQKQFFVLKVSGTDAA